MPRHALALAVALAVASPALAGSLEGVTLPDEVSAGGKTLVLNGLGLREATILKVNVYVAGLYVPAKTSDPEAILKADLPKQIVMRFVRNVGKEKLAEAWNEGFEKNAGAAKDAVAAGLQKLDAAMEDVRSDDTIVLTYVPESGTSVTVKGKDAGTIPGADFARVLFSIWLGPNPPNIGLRDGMLGRAPAR
jgi:chalcone isomerase-like protein